MFTLSVSVTFDLKINRGHLLAMGIAPYQNTYTLAYSFSSYSSVKDNRMYIQMYGLPHYSMFSTFLSGGIKMRFYEILSSVHGKSQLKSQV